MALTQVQKRLLEAAREAAVELGDRGRALTSLIGELSACEKANLTWELSDGYDAVSGQDRFQIKSRKSWSTPKVNPAGRLGRFGRKKGYPFDVGIYVALDDEFNVVGIWKMGVSSLKALEDAESANRGLHVDTFVKNAEPVFVS
jgi:hypothetical protein